MMMTCHMIHYHDGVSKFMLMYSVDTLQAHPRHTRMQLRPVRPARHSLGGNLRRLVRNACRIFRLKTYLDRWSKRWTYLQLSTAAERRSLLCGHYCIYFCMLRSSGLTMYEIVASFSTDTGFNDSLVHAFACRRLLTK